MPRPPVIYTINAVKPYINWLYFFHAWSLNGKATAEQATLREEADRMLDEMNRRYHTRAVFDLFEANSDGDDLLLNGKRLPFLRQQRPSVAGQPCLCLTDFVRPLASGVKDCVGAFAATVDTSMEHDYRSDDFCRMLAQTLCDRLAEATAEKLHEEVRRTHWGYAPGEQLTPGELHREAYQGIRPAVGYPSLPDTSVNFLLDDLLGMKRIGIRLTESGMMTPHASVSGFMFAHPQARYFDLGRIGDDQLADYARRRGLPTELMRRFLQTSLMKRR